MVFTQVAQNCVIVTVKFCFVKPIQYEQSKHILFKVVSIFV